MRLRLFDWIAALVLAAALLAAGLWPVGPRPEDLELEVVSVTEQAPAPGYPQQIEVKIRWHWRRPVTPGRQMDSLVLGMDRGYWIPTVPSQSQGTDDDLLTRLGVSGAVAAYQMAPGQDGEKTFVLTGWQQGRNFRADRLPLHVHWLHWNHPESGLPGRTWVRSTGGVFGVR